MNRSLISGFLLIVYFIAWLKPIYPFLDYQLHKQYIASELCEKKDIPNNTCQGKCHLKKQLKAATPIEDNDTKPTTPKINLEEYPVFTLQKDQNTKPQIKNLKLTYVSSITYNFLFSSAIFHPPKLIFNI